jgi:hypothetical protein
VPFPVHELQRKQFGLRGGLSGDERDSPLVFLLVGLFLRRERFRKVVPAAASLLVGCSCKGGVSGGLFLWYYDVSIQ